MNRSREVEAKVGIFVTLGLALVMLTILMLGGGQSFFERNYHFKTVFPQIEGLIEGAMVKIAGVRVGQVTEIRLLKDTGHVEISFNIEKKFRDVVRADSIVGVRTLGVLGDRYVVVSPGSPTAPLAEENSRLESELPKDFKDYLSTADQTLERFKESLGHLEGILAAFQRENRSEIFFKNLASLSTNANSGTKDLKTSMDKLNSIMTKIDKGQGTLGALVNDPSLYEDLKALLGGANRNKVLKYFIRKSVEESRDAGKDKPPAKE